MCHAISVTKRHVTCIAPIQIAALVVLKRWQKIMQRNGSETMKAAALQHVMVSTTKLSWTQDALMQIATLGFLAKLNATHPVVSGS